MGRDGMEYPWCPRLCPFVLPIRCLLERPIANLEVWFRYSSVDVAGIEWDTMGWDGMEMGWDGCSEC